MAARVLFVCAGNTCRSVFAEYIGRAVFGADVQFESAGLSAQTASDADNAVFTLQRLFGIDARSHTPRNVGSLQLHEYELIIAMDKDIARRLAFLRDMPPERVKVWAIADPWGGDLSEYESCALAVKKRILRLKKATAER